MQKTRPRMGVNYTGVRSYRAVAALLRSQDVDFVEILIDNFLDIDFTKFAQFLERTDCAFHIMFSRFLESDIGDLGDIGARIRTVMDALAPIYVSDHLLQFTHAGMHLPYLQELNYDDVTYRRVRDRVDRWQSVLRTEILFENFPSMDDRGKGQADFFQTLISDTGCGILMDLSNLFIAHENGGDSRQRWAKILDTCIYFHIGGARQSPIDPTFWIDAHDCAVAPDILQFAARCWPKAGESERFITVEWDHNIKAREWRRSIRRVAEGLSWDR